MYNYNTLFQNTLYNEKHKEDCIMGNIGEDTIKPILEKYLNIPLNTTETFDTYDFYNKEERIYIELKCRRVKKKHYTTTMIPYCKYIKGIEYLKNKTAKKIYYVFKFTDKLCIYKLKKNDNMLIKMGGTQRRGIKEYRKHIYIPVNQLKNIHY